MGRPRTFLVANRAGIGACMGHLHGLGHRRIAFLGRIRRKPSVEERVAAFRAERRRLGLRAAETTVMTCRGNTQQDGAAAAERLLGLSPAARPTALCCATDTLATGAIQALQKAGLRVPEDISIAGFDDVSLSRIVRPRLTTVAVPRAEMGRCAARQLLRMIQEGSAGRVIEHPTRLVVRESTCAAGG